VVRFPGSYSEWYLPNELSDDLVCEWLNSRAVTALWMNRWVR
jgi:hypothetical protein